MFLRVSTILVPQGAEYKAVCQGLRRVPVAKPCVVPIPVGPVPLTRYLEKLRAQEKLTSHPQPQVLLLGLCGSLTAHHQVGDRILYQGCIDGTRASPQEFKPCSPELTTLLHQALSITTAPATALTSDRFIWSAAEKHQLSQHYAAQVIDMEGFAALEVLSQAGISVGMLRVVSDNCNHDLPDLNAALSLNGTLQPWPLTMGLLRQPVAASRLIQGSLRGLQVLQELTTCLFTG
ncbi:MAG TPA: hypothetical protein V6D03_16240 [Candidatus Caenarcaniphilales bacterium]